MKESELPPRSKIAPRKNFPALDFEQMPAFMAELATRSTVSAVALRFLILTATRSNETLGARWEEIDVEKATWTVPGSRTKSGRPHIVPLSSGALAQVESMKQLRDERGYLFPGRSGGRQSEMTLLALLQRRMKRNVTVHGFRSSFRDWCGDAADAAWEIAEAALAHVVANETVRAYRRKTAVEKRRELMQQWSDYCLPPSSGKIVDIGAARPRPQTAA